MRSSRSFQFFFNPVYLSFDTKNFIKMADEPKKKSFFGFLKRESKIM